MLNPLYLKIADTTNPYFGAIVPCAGFYLSTQSINIIKILYYPLISQSFIGNISETIIAAITALMLIAIPDGTLFMKGI